MLDELDPLLGVDRADSSTPSPLSRALHGRSASSTAALGVFHDLVAAGQRRLGQNRRAESVGV